MDIFIPIAICFILFVFFSLCGMCCKRRRDQGAIIATPVVITSTQHHVGPYPVSQMAAPPPVGGAPGAGVVMQHHNSGTGMYPVQQPMPGYNQSVGGAYPPQQYPAPQGYPPQGYQQQQHQMPMPMPMPVPGSAPPMANQAMMNPPSYDQIVSEGYAKQAPYNPNYSGQ